MSANLDNVSKGRKGAGRSDAPIFLRLSTEERRRLKVATAELGLSYAEFVMSAVARHERGKRAKPVVAASPLHTVAPSDLIEFDEDED